MNKISKPTGILLIVLFIWLMFSGCSLNNKIAIQEEAMDMTSFEQIGKILRECDIDGVTDELLKKTAKSFESLPPEVELDKLAAVLTDLGSGVTDYKTLTWTPSSSSVYCFDVEVFDISSMYTNFLKGIEALGSEEISFTDIEEDDSNVDWDSGTGTIEVRFKYNGVPYALKATAMGDWFDTNFIGALNGVIGNNGKCLYYTGDGYQECIVFYRDNNWAKLFESKTGHKLISDYREYAK